jgi:hypothetical protein
MLIPVDGRLSTHSSRTHHSVAAVRIVATRRLDFHELGENDPLAEPGPSPCNHQRGSRKATAQRLSHAQALCKVCLLYVISCYVR